MLYRRLSLILTVAMLAALIVAAPGFAKEEAGPTRLDPKLERADRSLNRDGPETLAPNQVRIRRQTPLPTDAPQALADAKAPQGAMDDGLDTVTATLSPAPRVTRHWNGIETTGVTTPSSAFGAIGPTRYVEVTSEKVAVYDRAGTLLDENWIDDWFATPAASQAQVIWDETTRRFYYTGVYHRSATEHGLAFGYSMTPSPNDMSLAWCSLTFNFGTNLPDSPMLGDSKHFVIIGSNIYGERLTWRGSDILAVTKPPADDRCLGTTELRRIDVFRLSVDGESQTSPAPANQIDSNSTGWVITRPAVLPSTSLGVFKVTRTADGIPDIQSEGVYVTVPNYDIPLDAPQKDSQYPLYTGDARLTQAVAAIDPRLGGTLRIWTQHTVAGGAGARVRWYEINPATARIAQTGVIGNRNLNVFNAAISPDRLVRGSIRAFGSNMVIGFNTSSANTYPRIWMASKRGADALSRWVTVRKSAGPSVDDSCSAATRCSWSSIASASPDPSRNPLGETGAVWLTNQWTVDGNVTGPDGVSWRTWNWAAKP